MNKNFFSLLLIVAMTVTVSSFASESKAKGQIEKETTSTVIIKDSSTQEDSTAKEATTLDKVVAPVVKAANFVANNVKAALAVEVAGVFVISYVIYKSFFASDENEEDFE